MTRHPRPAARNPHTRYIRHPDETEALVTLLDGIATMVTNPKTPARAGRRGDDL